MFFTIGGILALRPVAYRFGARGAEMLRDIMTRGRICLLFNLALQAQYAFQSYLVAAEKPKFAGRQRISGRVRLAVFHAEKAGEVSLLMERKPAGRPF